MGTWSRASLTHLVQARAHSLTQAFHGFATGPGVRGHSDTVYAGDHLLLAVSEDVRAETEHRLRAIGESGRLAVWYGAHRAEASSR